MSISTMARLIQERQAQDSAAHLAMERDLREKMGGVDENALQKSTMTALERLTGFVPTEVITGWGAAVGLLLPTRSWQRWAIFGAAVAVMVVLLLLELVLRDRAARDLHRAQGRPSPVPQTTRSQTIVALVIATVAFAVWAFAVPGSPAVSWGEGVTRVFAVVAIPVSAILYKVAQLAGVAPIESR